MCGTGGRSGEGGVGYRVVDKGLQHVLGALLEVVGRERIDDAQEVHGRRHLQVRPVTRKDATAELPEYVVHVGATCVGNLSQRRICEEVTRWESRRELYWRGVRGVVVGVPFFGIGSSRK